MAIVDARVRRELQLSETKEKQSKKLSADQEFLVISDTKNPLFSDILANTATFANLGGEKLPQLDDVVSANGVQLVVTGRSLAWHQGSDRAVVMKVKYAGFEAEGDDPSPPDGTNEETWRRITARTQQVTVPARGWDTLALATAAANDFTNHAPLNSAGDPVEGIEEDVAMIALTYTNPKVVAPNFDNLNAYTNTCNGSAQFLGGGQYTVRCVGWSGEYDEKVQAWNISVEFLYKPDGWMVEFIDAGFNELIGGNRQVILDTKGNPVNQPVPLDNNGQALPPGVFDVYTREIYPYKAWDLNNIWDACGI
jgi:hypothetical protein